jgi:aminopeptidase
MIIEDLDYTSYAELLIDSGINLQKGQNLLIRFHVGGSLLARKCAETAYRRGAGCVELKLQDTHILKARIAAQAGDEKALDVSPGWMDSWQDTVLEEGWAYLALESYEDVGLLSDTDQNAMMVYEKLQQNKMRRFRDAVTSHQISWCVAGVPGPAWAERILGKGKSTADLWRVLRPILLLDREDPVEAWKEKAETLIERSDKLNALKLETLRFADGKGTDLTIGLLEGSIWMGGPEDSGGRVNMPNIPTEEVFTTPDRMKCDGTVRVTRPVEVRGTLVKGAVLTFRNGVLVEFDAEEGREALAGYVGTDPGACRLGEVALVGEDSPIAGSGLIFGSILYDENASCHIALGSGYLSCIAGGRELDTDEKKEAAGCNVSLVHRDFMIGSRDIQVSGTGRDGRVTEILRDGMFLI